ncbi:MAG: TIGR04551 family protein [Myxococcota bacterium]
MRFFSVFVSSVALAQYGAPAPGGGGFGEEQQQETKEGPAEQAPEEPSSEAELTPPRWPGEEEAKIQFLEAHGYLRFRGHLLHNITLGALETSDNHIEPAERPGFFPGAPLSENTNLDCATREAAGADVDCPASTLAGGNMRFRLEPTFNVTEEVRIKSTFDIMDNVVLGATPEGSYFGKGGPDGYTPIVAFTGGQAPVESGKNWHQDAIRVKRIWGEVRTPVGELRFGRMPSHWGMGILANNGDCLDCNYGDAADRLLFATRLADHLVALGHDWAATGPTTASVNGPNVASARGGGQPIDAEQLDDVGQYFIVAGRIDKPAELAEKVDRGDTVLNYGGYFVWRKQDYDWASGQVPPLGSAPAADRLVQRDAYALIPDAWAKLVTRKLEVEFEGVYIHGQIDEATELGAPPGGIDIRQWGFAQRTTFKALRDTLRVGLEVGGASGDEAEMKHLNALGGALNTQPACSENICPAGADRASAFRFDPDYQVDLVLFREILGMVTNAVYAKSFVQYEPVETIAMRLDLIPSWALEPIATPGNESWYGIELDSGLFYENVEHGFHAGLQWGVFFSAGAFNSVADSAAEAEALGSKYWDGGIAQSLRGTLAITY